MKKFLFFKSRDKQIPFSVARFIYDTKTGGVQLVVVYLVSRGSHYSRKVIAKNCWISLNNQENGKIEKI